MAPIVPLIITVESVILVTYTFLPIFSYFPPIFHETAHWWYYNPPQGQKYLITGKNRTPFWQDWQCARWLILHSAIYKYDTKSQSQENLNTVLFLNNVQIFLKFVFRANRVPVGPEVRYLKDGFPRKNCCSFGFCPIERGGGPANFFCAFLVNKRNLFPPKGQ